MSRRLPTFIAATLLATLSASGVSLAGTQPAGAFGAAGVAPAVEAGRDFVPRQVVVKRKGKHPPRVVPLPRGTGVHEATAALRRNTRIAYAAPNYIATASVTEGSSEVRIPNDPGSLTEPIGPPGGWVEKQWSFLPWEGGPTPLLPISPGGINAVGAWRNLEDAKRTGARGVTVAVLDTGIAYRAKGKGFRRSPDFAPSQFVRGYDFVDRDPHPLDENGHGTHVAGTIGEQTNNGIGLTGLAYNAKLMPVRVLDSHGRGRSTDIARGIRYAVANGADVINMSFNFSCDRKIPIVDKALRQAYREGVVTVASVGNLGAESCVSPPSTGPRVIGVGGTTQGGCLGKYSLVGKGVDLVAPGGGEPLAGCPSVLLSPIFQVTFLKSARPRRFGEPAEYAGTSMAAAHVSGVAAMVIASGVVGKDPSPGRVLLRMQKTARSLGLSAAQQGGGLIDAAKATEPPPRQAARR